MIDARWTQLRQILVGNGEYAVVFGRGGVDAMFDAAQRRQCAPPFGFLGILDQHRSLEVGAVGDQRIVGI